MKLINGKEYTIKTKDGKTHRAQFCNDQLDHFMFIDVPGCIDADKVEVVGPNKHPHHDLIVEWAKDTSKVVQQYYQKSHLWVTDENPRWDIEAKYRFKPQREFIKGHWYPCLLDGRRFICECRDDEYLYEPINANREGVANIKWSFDFDGLYIGDSLGEIKFGD